MARKTGVGFTPVWWALLLLLAMPPGASAQPIPGDVDGDGDVDINDINLILAARNVPTDGPSDPRDIDGDGKITVLDGRRAVLLCTRPGCAAEAAQLAVDSSPVDILLLPGQSANFTTSVTYTTTDSVARSVTIVQTVSGSGISVQPGVTSGFVASSTMTNVDSQTVFANSPGTFTVTTTASIPVLALVRSTVVTVRVVESLDTLSINVPVAEPGALAPDVQTDVLFSVQVDGFDTADPPVVSLQAAGFPLDVFMADDGTFPDAEANDGIYSVFASINTDGLDVGTCLAIRAVVDGQTGEPLALCVSGLPIGLAPSDTSDALTDPETSLLVVKDEVVIVFAPGTTESDMHSVAALVGGVIVGSIHELSSINGVGVVAQVRLSPAPTTFEELAALIAVLNVHPSVLDASPNAIGQTSEVVPNDPRYPTQYALTRVRADEAWVISRGAGMIAVLDTGVDYGHPDLAGKVVLGRDFVNNDNDPRDDHGHGTHVAGIAAARTNNGAGIAGASWNSPILAVKMLAANGSGTNLQLNLALIHAVARGSRILNLSLQNFGSSVCLGVNFARFLAGRLVVSAAGNNNSSVLNYPGACAGSFAIGNTTSTDGKSPSSNFGPWLDLSAPGHQIISTMPTYNVTMTSPSVPRNFASLTGTSMAAPLVAGGAALLVSRWPGISAAQIEDRLKRAAVPLPAGLQLGAGRMDLFETLFGGSFEDANLPAWTRAGTASSVVALGPLVPQHLRRMAFVSTGPAGDQVSGSLAQSFTIQPGVASIPIRVTYTFVSEEFPEFVGTIFNDAMRISLQRPDGSIVTLAQETVNTAAFAPIGGINFPGGDNTTGWTGWRTVVMNVAVTQGPGTYRIFVTDAGDDIYDSVVLVDNIRFK